LSPARPDRAFFGRAFALGPSLDGGFDEFLDDFANASFSAEICPQLRDDPCALTAVAAWVGDLRREGLSLPYLDHPVTMSVSAFA
jgi:hypothetical protein